MNTTKTELYTFLINFRFFTSLLFFILIFLISAYPIIYFPASWRFRSRWYYGTCSLLIRGMLLTSGIKLRIKGQVLFNQITTAQPAIIILNHQSCIDVWISEILLGTQPRIMLSNDYSTIPLFGTLLHRMNVVVRRITARSSQVALNDAITLARSYNNHIVLFPEGTRHADGNIHSFYRGFTVLAEQLKRPVVPVFLHGFHKIIPKGSHMLRTRNHEATVHVGAPFYFDPSQESREEFLAKVHNWFKLENYRIKQN